MPKVLQIRSSMPLSRLSIKHCRNSIKKLIEKPISVAFNRESFLHTNGRASPNGTNSATFTANSTIMVFEVNSHSKCSSPRKPNKIGTNCGWFNVNSQMRPALSPLMILSRTLCRKYYGVSVEHTVPAIHPTSSNLIISLRSTRRRVSLNPALSLCFCKARRTNQ